MKKEEKQQLALEYFHKKEYENALTIFRELARKKKSTENLFNVLMCLAELKKTDECKEILGKLLKICKKNKENAQRELCEPYIRFYYANALCDGGAYDEALEQVDFLKECYLNLKITDDTFLYLRGVPFLSQTLALTKRICEKKEMDLGDLPLLRELEKGVDNDGKEKIRKALRGEENTEGNS